MNIKKILLILGLAVLFQINIFAEELHIVSQPRSTSVCIGGSAVLRIQTEGGGGASYKWKKSSSPDGPFFDMEVPDEDSLYLTDFNTSFVEYFMCVVTDISTHESIDSEVAAVTVYSSIPIVQDIILAESNSCLGSANLLESQIENGNNIYAPRVKWFRNNVVIRENSIGYSIGSVSQNDEGNYFFVACNTCGSDTSDIVNLHVIRNPAITTQPQPVTVCVGDDVILTGDASGEGLNYKWLRDEIDIPGEDQNTFEINDIQQPHSFFYKLVAYNQCTSDTSLGVFISVNALPVINTHPEAGETCIGDVINLLANANTDPYNPLSFQWYNILEAIEGADESVFALTITENVYTKYYCAITNSCGTVRTDTAEIEIGNLLFVEQPTPNNVLCVGDNLSLSVKVRGTLPANYQWFFGRSNVSGANVSGSTSANLTITDVNIGQAGLYFCKVSNTCGSIDSDTVELIVNEPVLIYPDLTGNNICEGNELNLTFGASGTAPLEYAWRKINNNEIISSDEEITINSAGVQDSGEYYCIVSNVCGEESTDTVNVNVRMLPHIESNPNDITVCPGDELRLEVSVNGEEPLSYAWYRNESAVSGQNSNVLYYANSQLNHNGEYYCKISNQCGEIFSDTVMVEIKSTPRFITHPSISESVCLGETIELRVVTDREDYSFQWYFNDNPITGQTDSIMSISDVTSQNEGVYYCKISNGCETVNSNISGVEIKQLPEVDLGPDIHACEGDIVTLSTDEVYYRYSWNNGVATTPTFDTETAGTFILEVRDNNFCKNSDTIDVYFHDYFDFSFEDRNIIVCDNSTVLSAPTGGYSYLWSNGETTSSITVTESGTYYLTVMGSSYGCETIDSVNVDFQPVISIDLGEDISIPENSSVVIGVESIYQSYLWNTGLTMSTLLVDGYTYGQGEHTFWLEVTTESGCTVSDTIIITITESSHTNISSSTIDNYINIYPNPADQYIDLFNENGIIKEIAIYTTTGQQIHNKIINNDKISLDVSTFATGIYYVKVTNEKDEVSIKKLIKR